MTELLLLDELLLDDELLDPSPPRVATCVAPCFCSLTTTLFFCRFGAAAVALLDVSAFLLSVCKGVAKISETSHASPVGVGFCVPDAGELSFDGFDLVIHNLTVAVDIACPCRVSSV